MDIPRLTTGSGDLQAELQRLEREIEELRTRLAHEALASEDARRSRRRLARTSRVESQLIGSRPLRVVPPSDADAAPIASLADARSRRSVVADDDDDGPQAA